MSADAKGKASYLSRDEERELIGRWQRYDEEAGKALLRPIIPSSTIWWRGFAGAGWKSRCSSRAPATPS